MSQTKVKSKPPALGVWGPEVLQQIVDLGGDGFSNWINHMDAASRQFRQNAISQGIGEFMGKSVLGAISFGGKIRILGGVRTLFW
jgi:hypothetical protein